MERHFRAFGIKFILVSIIILSLYGIFYHLSLGHLLFLVIFISGLSYVLGDMILYPRMGNLWATVLDAFLYFALTWGLTFSMIGDRAPIILIALAATYFLTIAEPLFHTYLKERVYGFEDPEEGFDLPGRSLQLEMSEEFDQRDLQGEAEGSCQSEDDSPE